MCETAPTAAASCYHRKNPFPAKLTSRGWLTKAGSDKETRHFVINLAGSSLSYTPGDSIGIYARNPVALVEETIAILGLDPQTTATGPAGQSGSFRDILLSCYTLNRASKKFMSGLIERIPQGEQRNQLMELVRNDAALNEYIFTRDYVDILKDYHEAKFLTPEGFLSQLGTLTPRLYSIASSPKAHPDEVHLCVAVVRFDTHGRKKKGLCSGFLADDVELNTPTLPIFMQESKTFRLPADGRRDVIMCGPGTGIAPFRAFLERRASDGSTGRNWLFFGEQRRATNFYFEDEFRSYQQKGTLHRLDLAFSRDQPEKIYVQDRIRENGAELWQWLQGGAYFYVCGDAKRMAKDVNQALIDGAQKHGGLTLEAATEYVNTTLMRTEKRYLRDVY